MKRYQRYKTAQIVAGTSIPIASFLVPIEYVRTVTALLGALVAGIESYLHFRRYQHHWIRWRTTAEALKREAFLYAQQAGPYKASIDREILLAERVEEVITHEQESWKLGEQRPKPSAGTWSA
jgi:hypothetical protein